jgi:hypothetical protein
VEKELSYKQRPKEPDIDLGLGGCVAADDFSAPPRFDQGVQGGTMHKVDSCAAKNIRQVRQFPAGWCADTGGDEGAQRHEKLRIQVLNAEFGVPPPCVNLCNLQQPTAADFDASSAFCRFL